MLSEIGFATGNQCARKQEFVIVPLDIILIAFESGYAVLDMAVTY